MNSQHHHDRMHKEVEEAISKLPRFRPLNTSSSSQQSYDSSLTFLRSPCKYVKQKWLNKRSRQQRYSVDDRAIKKYDERRLIDARFFVFLIMSSNALFQVQSTMAPLEGTKQLEVNIIYWFVTMLLIMLCLGSFIKMHLIKPAVLIIFIRSCIPMFDPEQRRDKMDPDQWNYLVTFQTAACILCMMVFMNCIDQYVVLFAFMMMSLTVLGAIQGIFRIQDLIESQSASFIIMFLYGQMLLTAFLYIQKRMHKEVFIEVKKKNQLSNEFKTIFDELDAAIFIFNDERITHLNMAFSWLLLQHFGSETMSRIVQFANAYELSEMEKENRKEQSRKSKCQKVFEYLCCWRSNMSGEEIVSMYEDQQFKFFQGKILSHGLFKVYAQNQKSSGKSTADSIQKEVLSFRDVMMASREDMDKLIFEVPTPGVEEANSSQFVQVKIKEYAVNSAKKLIVQIVDVSQDILYQKAHAENEFLSIANATVSHELRNPLQSILSQGLKVELCTRELVKMIESKSSATVQEVSRSLKEVVRTLKASNSIQQSSSSMMAFLVDDILDFSQIKAGKLRKVVKTFEAEKAIGEVVKIQKDKAEMQGISLKALYKPQLIGEGVPIVSIFQAPRKKSVLRRQTVVSNEGDSGAYDLALLDTARVEDFKGLPRVSTDSRRLQQVLLNLQSNAIKFTERGGRITVAFTLYKQDGKSYIEIQVKDSGLGIKEEDQDKLFKLFGFVETTQEVNTRGIGLGLVISHRICEAFGGDIGFRSEWGRGSIFGFRFELARDLRDDDLEQYAKMSARGEFRAIPHFIRGDENLGESGASSDGERGILNDLVFGANDSGAQGLLSRLPQIRAEKGAAVTHEIMAVVEEEERARGRILIVDDEPFNVDSLQVILQCALPQAAGLERRIDRAFNGHEAVEQFKRAVESDLKYTLILMDCNMPKMDGYTATALIKQFARDVGAAVPYVMAVTAHSEEKYVERCLESGMDFVLPKPAGVQQLKEAVNHLSF